MTLALLSIIDVSAPMHAGMPVYPGDPEVAIDVVSTASAEAPGRATLERYSASTHAGTHVDAPAHVVPGGLAVDELPIELLCGPARVVDLERAGRAIDADALRGLGGLDATVVRLLLRTCGPATGPASGFDHDYAHLTVDAAEYLRARTAVRLLGIDSPSVEPPRNDALEVHRVLLAIDPPIVIVEGLELGHVAAGDYELLCLPIRLRGASGAPARAALRAL
jgi:arylformamidase